MVVEGCKIVNAVYDNLVIWLFKFADRLYNCQCSLSYGRCELVPIQIVSEVDEIAGLQ